MGKTDFDLTIQSLADGGWGVGRREGKVVFVPFTAPGDVIRCAITGDRGRFAFGALVELLNPSPARVVPPCPVFGRCGGCQWQHVHYGLQLSTKRDILIDALTRIGRLGDVEASPTVGSPRPYGWRTKVDLAFVIAAGRVKVGLYSRRSSEIIPITGCPVAGDEINARIGRLGDAIAALNLKVNGEIALLAGTDNKVSAHLKPGARATVRPRDAERFLEIAALSGLEAMTTRGTAMFGDPIVSYPGWDGKRQLPLFCRPSGFVQANPDVNRELINCLLSYDVSGKRVLDLYCGIGNLTVPMAAAKALVTGVEASRASVEDARKTAKALGLSGATFVTGDAADILSDPEIRRTVYDVIVLDPPRAGARQIMEKISELRASDILYVSCSPATLARDIAALTGDGWRLVSAVPLDMFPQTFHAETLCRLEKA